ncbi:hypothetical protein BDZ94DRAFT_1189645 [Collybia nuda]|uniref:Uncharacterized protein n=1 Tax=Collybia nuda TaxID=64659 RepID=A0A9P5YA86_9AGAR|nr:hypothetical protein BDZ94DRAFT_1189645 [Collybia nuda]
MNLISFLLLSGATIVSGLTTKIIKSGAECGGDVKGVCAPETQCSTGKPGSCIPSKYFNNNSTIEYTEVTGYGRPMADELLAPADDVIPVFTACTDSNFGGSCVTWSLACDFCAGLGNGWTNTVSSIRMLNPSVGCNFWVNSNCVGDGINIDSGAIFDLSATNYNDRTVAFNCYLTGR